jgi:hypothetical protein
VAVVLLIGVAGFLDAAVEPAAAADSAATDAAIELAREVPWADVVLVGASELGLRARLRAERRPPERTVLLWLEPASKPAWRSAHPTLAALAEGAGERRRGRALPAGSRPALALCGPRPALERAAGRVVEALYSEASVTK